VQLELLTIGDELLLGQTVDTNAAELARVLAGAGVRVAHRSTVGDDIDSIMSEVEQALARSGAVITTGGLGPTRDDKTKVAVARLLGLPLEFRDEVWAQVVARFAHFGRTPNAANRTQAEVPSGATVLPNRWGTAPGLWVETTAMPRPGLVIMLPGVPHEMRMLLRHEVLPRLAARTTGTVVRSRTLRTMGVPESTLAETIGAMEERIAPLTLAYLPSMDGVDLRLTAWNLDPADADARLTGAGNELRERVGDAIYGEDGADLAAVVLEAAQSAGRTLAVAESCTGGLLGGRLSAVPGASHSFVGGVIAYANDVKQRLLDVPAAMLEQEGAVSESVACAMAAGVRARTGADLTVAVTGIAGPDGGTTEKPVGTVWFATAMAEGETRARRLVFGGARNEIRARAAQAALGLLLDRLRGDRPR
jgi:nicotinamide-nucleotide amidase